MQGTNTLKALSISSLTDKDISQIRAEAMGVQEHLTSLGNTSEDDKKAFARKMLKQKREKKDYRLYPLYVSIKAMEDQCAPTMNELLVLQEDGTWLQTDVYKILAETNPSNADMLKQMEILWMPSAGKADVLKKQWIKEKVIQTRYTRRGQEFVEKLQLLVDDLFSLATLCVNVQILISELTKGVEDV